MILWYRTVKLFALLGPKQPHHESRFPHRLGPSQARSVNRRGTPTVTEGAYPHGPGRDKLPCDRTAEVGDARESHARQGIRDGQVAGRAEQPSRRSSLAAGAARTGGGLGAAEGQPYANRSSQRGKPATVGSQALRSRQCASAYALSSSWNQNNCNRPSSRRTSNAGWSE